MINFKMKNTKKKLNGQFKTVKTSFQQVDVASSLSRTQSSLVLHSFIATFPGSNITKYTGLNTVAKYMDRKKHHKIYQFIFFLPCGTIPPNLVSTRF